jgi:hypothetical protein
MLSLLAIVVDGKWRFFTAVMTVISFITLLPIWAYNTRHPGMHVLTTLDMNNAMIAGCQTAFVVAAAWLLQEPIEDFRLKLMSEAENNA